MPFQAVYYKLLKKSKNPWISEMMVDIRLVTLRGTKNRGFTLLHLPFSAPSPSGAVYVFAPHLTPIRRQLQNIHG